MSELGTTTKPAIVRLKTQERAEAVAALCRLAGWRFIAGVEPDKPESVADVQALLSLHPLAPDGTRLSKSEPCPCESGKKYAKCCRGKTSRLNERLQRHGKPPIIMTVDEAIKRLALLGS